MKNISILFACLVAVLSFSSCKDDTCPRLDKDPASLKLDLFNPPMANQYFDLTQDGTFDLQCSQPDYGFAAVTNYAVQVSLSKEFKRKATNAPDFVAEAGDYVELREPSTMANMQVRSLYLTRAICKLLNIKSEDQFASVVAAHADANGYMPVYIRVRAYIEQDEAMSSVVSKNIVELKSVKPFFSLEEPGFIWLIGKPTDWQQDEAAVISAAEAKGVSAKVSELASEIDSKVYHWKGNIAAGDFQFRFYTQLGDWEANSLGSQVDDNPIDIVMEDGVYAGDYVAGKGSWQIPDWPGGLVEITVDMNEETVNFRAVSE